MDNHLYKLLYDITVEEKGVLKKDIPEGMGACDALLISSVIYPADGSFSINFISVDGQTNTDMTFDELFKIWAIMANMLSEHKNATPGKAALCNQVFDVIRAALIAYKRSDG